jgi:hypothetical protein
MERQRPRYEELRRGAGGLAIGDWWLTSSWTFATPPCVDHGNTLSVLLTEAVV